MHFTLFRQSTISKKKIKVHICILEVKFNVHSKIVSKIRDSEPLKKWL